MLERVVLHGAPPRARVETERATGDLPLFVARAVDAAPPEDGVLLREGLDTALVRVGGALLELPLFQERPDGTVVRVRVARVGTKRSR